MDESESVLNAIEKRSRKNYFTHSSQIVIYETKHGTECKIMYMNNFKDQSKTDLSHS